MSGDIVAALSKVRGKTKNTLPIAKLNYAAAAN